MLTLQQIKENPTLIIERLAVKGFDGKEPIEKILELDNSRRQLQLDNDNQAASLRQLAARIGSLMKEGKKEEAEETKKEVAALKGVTAEEVIRITEENARSFYGLDGR